MTPSRYTATLALIAEANFFASAYVMSDIGAIESG